VALYDVDGTATGAAITSGPLAVLTSATGTSTGGSAALTPAYLEHQIVETLLGSAIASANTQGVHDVSGFVVGSGELVDARLLDAAGVAVGGSNVTADLARMVGVSGMTWGSSLMSMSLPETIYGTAVVTAYMDVIHVLPSVCETPLVTTSFRWGHTFSVGDLEICIVDQRGNPLGPVCVHYTLYQMLRGCALKQVGPANRKPASSGVGCYYATGTAGECGQPGVWAIKWSHQRTFGAPVVEKVCYFQVVDSVSSPILGDTLQRACKYGWD